ncbi:DUF4007 family protein [Brevundimonas sp.]|uniref:DUF4007 family protein n=1 Tax=Brevundimonas sp. TaxID=1871086 RepID=UPI001A321584|nr:DUF4007 family protein [Brevundimonas sp.]MBJ7483499.1 DUF4007 family protein [Brevundimonas sp.]
MRNTRLESESRLQFAGHETFPLRLLWLKKTYDAVRADAEGADGAPRRTFQEHDAIARFGIGKNMVMSMRHWALASGMIVPTGSNFTPTAIAHRLLSDDGLDPFLESSATLWLIHAILAGTPTPCTTFYYAFNILNQAEFDRDGLNEAMLDLARNNGARATPETIKRDVEVFLRSYVSRTGDGGEDAAEPLLAELGLIREARLSGRYEFVRGPQPSLPDGIFALHLSRFWTAKKSPPTLTVEAIAYEPGSPGRVFKMDEDSVVTRLTRLSDVTRGAFQWTDTAGLRQVNFLRAVDDMPLIAASFGAGDGE